MRNDDRSGHAGSALDGRTIHMIVPMACEPMWLTARCVRNKLMLLDAFPRLRFIFVSEKENTKNDVCVRDLLIGLPAQKRPRARFLISDRYTGSIKGGAIHTGFHAALSAGGHDDVIGFTDLDAAISNHAIERFLMTAMSMPQADLVIASRIGRSPGERVASVAFQTVVKTLFIEVAGIRDLQTGLKLATRALIEAYYRCHDTEHRSYEVGFNIDWDLIGFALRFDFRIEELAVPWETNKDYSSRNLANVTRTLVGVIRKRCGRGGGVLPRGFHRTPVG
jgi:hypothetical protein